MLERHKTLIESGEKRRSELASGSNIELSEEERNSQSSVNDLKDLDHLDVNDINVNHNEFFRHDSCNIIPSPVAQKKEQSFVSVVDTSLLNIKESGSTAVTE